MNDTTLHLRVESSAYIILSIIDWFVEKLMTSLLSVCWIDGLLRMIVFIVIVFLPTIFIKCLLIFLCNELTLAILYCVVGTCDDANLHLLSTQMNNSRWCGGRFFCWSCQADMIKLWLFWEKVVFCYQLSCSLFLDSFDFGHANPKFRYMYKLNYFLSS